MRYAWILFVSFALTVTAQTTVFEVTNTDDRGAGSFRAAIEAANTSCSLLFTSCRVVFAFSDCTQVQAVTLETPLPAITAYGLSIGGASSTSCRQEEPWLALDGSRLERGNGLEIGPALYAEQGNVEIRGLSLRDFPENGIAIVGPNRIVTLERNSIETSGGRGIVIDAPGAIVNINANTINRNFRSGVFIWNALTTELLENRIIGNGASGVFIGPLTEFTAVRQNEIAGHPQFGIAVTPGRRWVQFLNGFHGNMLDVDAGLDGPSPNDRTETDGILNAPELLDAVYDPVRKVVTVTGSIKTVGGAFGEKLRVFFSVAPATGAFGMASGAGSIGVLNTDEVGGTLTPGAFIELPFTVEIAPTDPAGLYVTAHAVVYNGEGTAVGQFRIMSEYSRPVRIH